MSLRLRLAALAGRRGRRPASRVHPIRTAPWRRAPLLLLRRPVIFCGLAVATGVLAIAASAGPLFASTLGTASLRAQAADDCAQRSMPSVYTLPEPDYLVHVNAAGVAAIRSAGIPGHAYWADTTGAAIQATQITLFARAGALEHVQLLTPDHGQAGAWFPDDFAAKLGAKPGDDVRATQGTIHVAGIYRNLSPDPFHLANLPAYWCTWADFVLQKVTNGAGTPPFLIADAGTVATIAARYAAGAFAGAFTPTGLNAAPTGHVLTFWYSPLPLDRMSLVAVKSADARVATAYRALRAAVPRQAIVGRNETSYALYGTQQASPPPTPLTQKIQRAERVQHGLSGSVLPISLAGVLVALLLVAEAGGSWAARSSREVRLLASRGVGPVAIGLKAFLEALPATVVGLGGGYALSYLLMRTLAPTSTYAPGAAVRAAGYAATTACAGVLLVALVGGFSGRDRHQAPERSWPRLLRRLPYELLLLGGGMWTWLAIGSGEGIDYSQNITDVHPLLLIFPLLALSGVIVLLGRGTALLVPRLGPLARRLPPAGYLALRRIAGSRAIAVGLLLGTALPCGLLTYAGTVSTGVHDELIRKYQTNLGAPLVLSVIGLHEHDPHLAGHGTAVSRYQSGATLPGAAPITVMGLDPATFDRFAYTDRGQRADVHRVARGGSAAILVHAPDTLTPAKVRLGSTTLRIHVIARSDVFPGLRGVQPMLVVDRAVLHHVDPEIDRLNEVWTTTDQVAAVSRAIRHDGYSVLAQIDARIRVGNSGLLPITWIFGYLRALAVLIGAVAIAGLVFALSARTRRRTVAYVMSRRMGLCAGTHIRSLLVELLAVVGLGWLIGTAAGLAGYAVLTGSLDVQPQLPPGAQFALPVLSLATTAAVVAAVIALAAGGAHGAAERANPADILRLE